jgi:hypothetical protein
MNKVFRAEEIVRCSTRTVREDHGYVGTKVVTTQKLIRRHYIKGLFRTYTRDEVIDSEEVPQWVMIERGCYGSTSWRSKFYDQINAEAARKLDR